VILPTWAGGVMPGAIVIWGRFLRGDVIIALADGG
jgi:hypothetical protein